MPKLCSYGSVGVPAGNRRHYPETSNIEPPHQFDVQADAAQEGKGFGDHHVPGGLSQIRDNQCHYQQRGNRTNPGVKFQLRCDHVPFSCPSEPACLATSRALRIIVSSLPQHLSISSPCPVASMNDSSISALSSFSAS